MNEVLALTLALLASQTPAPEPPAQPAPKDEPPSIVLVTLSSIRRDHLGCYGYERATSPNLDALARESLTFERAYTPMASMLPAHLSLMTGAWPHRHGIVEPTTMQQMAWQPTKELKTAAMLLGEAGYRTAAFVSARATSRASGLDAGFKNFDEPGSMETRVASEATKRASAWLGEHASERFFLWVHYRGALPPSVPARECRVALAADENFSAFLATRGIAPKRFDIGIPKPSVARMLFPDQNYGAVNEATHLPPLDAGHFAGMFERYDGDLRCADVELGALVARLRELELFDQVVLAIVADHGLSLGQHDSLEAGEVNVENLHVPWILHLPKALAVEPARVARPVSLVDVLPTILARFDNRACAPLIAQGDGRDALSATGAREGVLGQRQVRSKSKNDPGPVWSWTTARWKYVHRPELSDKLFDVAGDPYELTNVIKEHPEVAAQLKAELLAALAPPAPRTNADER